MRNHHIAGALALLAAAACSPASEDTSSTTETGESAVKSESYAVIIAGERVGHLKVDHNGNEATIDYDYKNNGRGPTFAETVSYDEAGLPVSWSIKGATTFGNSVEETYALDGGRASWTDATGSGSADIDEPALYISQFGSPYSGYVYARALLKDGDNTLPALPAGELRLSEMETMEVEGESGMLSVTTYALSGADLDPDYIILDDQDRFFAYTTPRFIVIREGFEAEEERLRNLAADYGATRFEELQQEYAHDYGAPVRIQNVRVFQPDTLEMSDPVSVLVEGDRIAAIEAADATGAEGEVIIDGAGGSLIPGLYDMHGHVGDDDALMNLLAGITSIRDMGNEITVLEPLRERIESGALAGPRIHMSGFIEGISETNNSTGELASTEEEAVELVRMYAARDGYGQIKIYSSVKGEWVPAMAAEAHANGMRVAGHIPAFSTPDEMIEAGYDEITHLNQVMLSWVLPPDADTRTMQRITGIQLFEGIDLDSDEVQRTLNLMVENDVAHEPTLVIHEYAMLGRNGETNRAALDYIDHMPVAVQRNAKVALLNIADKEEDRRYRDSYDKVIEILTNMHERGIFLVPGTDMGGAFMLHREVELFTNLGMSEADVLKRATYDMAEYLGVSDSRGSIEAGKLADFFLVPGDPTADIKAIKTISLVSRGGTIYYPTEIYPEFGITPFTEIPTVSDQ
ncbi:amidohydrolase family protein [Hyphococcus flavus]|uniref:Amidohydrolase family protein n=1 Tax=Hyphococcus flavus TaxID=1866326 RepID=A0AAF0CGP9_9PROT|nr:amidohydrolase family protein [Hyphococcus flavus]WDI30927.1 amidohydrolase family protein [Hyphococcus flavus]